jgi:hypothetical protein
VTADDSYTGGGGCKHNLRRFRGGCALNWVAYPLRSSPARRRQAKGGSHLLFSDLCALCVLRGEIPFFPVPISALSASSANGVYPDPVGALISPLVYPEPRRAVSLFRSPARRSFSRGGPLAAPPILSAGGATDISPARERWVKAPARIPQRRRCDRFFSPNSTIHHL